MFFFMKAEMLYYRGKTNMMDYFVKGGCLRRRKRNWIQPQPRDPKYEIKECLIADVEEEALDLEVAADEPFTEENIILNNEVETTLTFAEEQLQQVSCAINSRTMIVSIFYLGVFLEKQPDPKSAERIA